MGNKVLKVSSKSKVNKVAGAIMKSFKEDGIVEMQAIGAGAVNQAIKSYALARIFALQENRDIILTADFIEVEVDKDVLRTVMKFYIEEVK